jgi:hypothetical protein
MLPDVNQTSKRRQLVFGANVARTHAQIRHIREGVDDWLLRHPDDEAIRRAGRRLERSEDRLRKAGEWH